MKPVRILGILTAIVLALCLAWPAGSASAGKQDKIMLVLPGPINDQGWNATAYQGLLQVKKNLGVAMKYIENIETANAESTLTDLGAKGYQLVIAHGTQYNDYAAKVAAKFPRTKYWIINGFKAANPNLGGVGFREWEAGWIAGVMAGLTTKTNKIGTIGAFPFPVIEGSMDAYEKAAKIVNPKVQVTQVFVNSWSDVAKGKESAKAMIEAGVDVIMTTANQVGIGSIQASQEAGVKAVGFVADQYDIAPGTVVGSVLFYTPKFFTAIVSDYLKGRLAPKVKTYGWKEGFFGLGKYDPATPERVRAAVKRHIADLSAGKYQDPYKPGKGTK
ncbi:MAG: BMP family protein [Nitrospinota bacterium]